LEEGVDGLVHISDLSWTKKIFNVEDFVKIGDMLDVIILGIDIDNHRIALGHKQINENPWDSLEQQYKVGTEVNCKIIKSLEKGIIVELPNVVDGFIPASQLSVYQIKNFGDLFQAGATLNAEVIEFDKDSKKIVLSVIEYLKDKDQKEIDEYIAKFKISKKFSLTDVIDRTRTTPELKEEVDFKIDDVIKETGEKSQ
jgi:small subunit ribosomal protein S1